jgi:hypothetical protein
MCSNVGSAANQLSTIAGTVTVGSANFSPTFLNINDQGDTAASNWAIGGGSINETTSFPGTISYQDVVGVVINAAGTKKNAFAVNDTAGTAALTLNTGTGANNSVTVYGTSYESTLDINNQGADCTTAVMDTYSKSKTYINDSASDAITLGNNGNSSSNGVGGIEGDVSISTKTPDSDTLDVNDKADGVTHTGNNAVTVTNRSIVGLARGKISYGPHTLSSLSLEGDGRTAIWNVQGTPIPYEQAQNVGGGGRNGGGIDEWVPLPTTTTIHCSGQDIVNVGGPSNGLQDISGTLNIDTPGTSAAVNLNLDDHETTYGTPCAVSIANTSITGNSVIGLGYVVINYGFLDFHGNVHAGGVSELTVRAGTGGTTFTVGDMTGGPTTVTLSALGKGNSIVGPDTSVNWTFQGHLDALDRFTQGSDASKVYFAGIGAITGGSGANDFHFIRTGFAGSIDGGSSGDSTLNFLTYGGSSLSVELTKDGSLNGVQGTAKEGTSFDNIDSVIGDEAADSSVGNTTPQNETYQGDFTHTLTVAAFANMELNVAGDFSGELLAPTEGTPAPIRGTSAPAVQETITVEGTVESTAIIKVKFLEIFTVEGDMDGIIKGFGDDPSVPSIQYIVVGGKVGMGAQLQAYFFGSVQVQQDFAGILKEGSLTADFPSLTIGGSFLPTGLIDAASGGTLSVTGDFSGEAVIAGALDTLSVGGTLDGIVSAGSYGSKHLGGPVTGQIDTGLTTAPPVRIAAGDVAELIQAIDQANLIAQPNVINLAAGSTYALTAPDNDTDGPNGLPAILSNITIKGNGAVIEEVSSTPFRIFYVAGGADVVLNGLTIEQGSSDSGGGVYNDGSLALNNDILTDNSATGNGGAVYNGGTLTVSNTTFSNNSAGGVGPNIFNAVAPPPTTTILTDKGPNASTFGQTVNFTVNVTGGVPDGENVTLEDASNGNPVVGSGAVTNGTANIAVINLSGGAHDLFAVYGGDSTLTGSQSSTVTQTVHQAPTFTSAPDVTFTVGASNSFAVTAAGYLTPTLSENTHDVLPRGISFDPLTGILSGTPALGTVGIYTLNFTAGKGIAKNAAHTLTLTVGEATPVITWNTPNPITYGTPLNSTELDATANVAGTFVYAQAAGTVLPAVDTPLLAVTFTPADTADYATVTQAVPLEVDPAPLTVYADSQTMTYGSAVPALTFTTIGFVNGDTAASLPGSLATVATANRPVGSYDIALGTLGNFAESENGIESNYNITYDDADLTVNPATPAITWTTPSPIGNQTPLSSAQLSATANVPGTFVYSPAAGAVLPTGTQTLSATFTPDDTADYLTADASVQLTVADAAAPVVTTQPSSQTATASGTAVFTAAASGGPSPTVQWQVNSGNGFMDVSTGGVYSLDAAGDLIITGATTTMSGYQYQAVFTNSSGSVTTSAATLNVTLVTTTTGLTDYGPIPSTTAQSINLTVTVSSGVPDGEIVIVEDASNGYAVVPTTGNTLADGSATLTIAAGALSGGTHNLFAVYGGDGTFARSQSAMLSQAVKPAPMILAKIPTQRVDVGQTLQINVSKYASDPNSPALPLTYRLVGSTPPGASIDPSTGILTWALGANQQIGSYALTVLVSDNGSPQRTASETININVVDPSPLTISSAQVTTKNGFAITLTLSGPVNPATGDQFQQLHSDRTSREAQVKQDADASADRDQVERHLQPGDQPGRPERPQDREDESRAHIDRGRSRSERHRQAGRPAPRRPRWPAGHELCGHRHDPSDHPHRGHGEPDRRADRGAIGPRSHAH